MSCSITKFRWPGYIKAGIWSNQIVSGLDWFPTLLAAAGDPTVKDKLLKGWTVSPGGVFKVHLDGYNILPYLEGKEATTPRKHFFYFDDDGNARSRAARELEVCLLRAARSRQSQYLDGTVYMPAASKAIQPPHGSVRARRHHF